MRKKGWMTGMILTMTLFCAACTGKSNQDADQQTLTAYLAANTAQTEYFASTTVDFYEELVYNLFDRSMGVYNLNTYTWTKLTSEYGEWYQSDGDQSIYTVGFSGTNYFSVVSVSDRTITSLWEVDVEDSLIPFGHNGNDYYFLYFMDDFTEDETRKLIVYNLDSAEAQDVVQLGLERVTNAVLLGESLYYVGYHQDGGSFWLYSYNMDTETEELLRTDLETNQIFVYDDKIYYVDKEGNMMDLDDNLLCTLRGQCDYEYVSEYGLMIQSYVNSEADITCDVIDLSSGEIIASAAPYIGYHIRDEQLLLYCTGEICTVELN